MIQPTRTNLLLLKDRLHAVLNCTTILKGRRQALIKEFLKITKPLMQSREEVSLAYARAIVLCAGKDLCYIKYNPKIGISKFYGYFFQRFFG